MNYVLPSKIGILHFGKSNSARYRTLVRKLIPPCYYIIIALQDTDAFGLKNLTFQTVSTSPEPLHIFVAKSWEVFANNFFA